MHGTRTDTPKEGSASGRDGLSGIGSARVMVVDDNRVNRHLLLALLERGGIRQVEMAEDGIDALNRMEAFKPDLILLDLMMPNLDGFEMCRRLRGMRQGSMRQPAAVN